MKRIVLVLCLVGCGSTANNYNGHSVPAAEEDAGVLIVDAGIVNAPEANDAQLTPCVSGTWMVRFVPLICPLCQGADLCQGHAIPPFQSVNVSNELQLLNCQLTLSSITNPHRCAYENITCVPAYGFGDHLVEEFAWNSTGIVFQKFTGEIPVAISNGQVLGEVFNGVEVGLGTMTSGLCEVNIVLTKEEQ